MSESDYAIVERKHAAGLGHRLSLPEWPSGNELDTSQLCTV